MSVLSYPATEMASRGRPLSAIAGEHLDGDVVVAREDRRRGPSAGQQLRRHLARFVLGRGRLREGPHLRLETGFGHEVEVGLPPQGVR